MQCSTKLSAGRRTTGQWRLSKSFHVDAYSFCALTTPESSYVDGFDRAMVVFGTMRASSPLGS